jgi:hypothetical protein
MAKTVTVARFRAEPSLEEFLEQAERTMTAARGRRRVVMLRRLQAELRRRRRPGRFRG